MGLSNKLCDFVFLADVLQTIFHSLYDVEAVAEDNWRKRGSEQLGRGIALHSVKGFFEWLETRVRSRDRNVIDAQKKKTQNKNMGHISMFSL